MLSSTIIDRGPYVKEENYLVENFITDKAAISALRWGVFFSEVDWFLFIPETNTIVRITAQV